MYLASLKTREEYEFITYDFWTLFSDVGGTLGFYLGATVSLDLLFLIHFFNFFSIITDLIVTQLDF